MIRKTLFTLFILIGIVLSVSCNPVQIDPTSQANIPNPASVYCEQQGNKLEIVTAADGSQNGVCVFPDGSSCDEWAYFRGECGPANQKEAPSDNAAVTVPAQVVINEPMGYCFSYPQGYTQIPYNDAVQIVAPDLLGTDTKGLFWLEISDSNDRTAEEVADQEMTYVAGLDVGRWTVTLGGEQALVLDGMPGQELQRRVYIVHQQTLYVLVFWPARSENKAASDQMEALYEAVTSSWAWSPCSARE